MQEGLAEYDLSFLIMARLSTKIAVLYSTIRSVITAHAYVLI